MYTLFKYILATLSGLVLLHVYENSHISFFHIITNATIIA
jgi:hypothetical protein